MNDSDAELYEGRMLLPALTEGRLIRRYKRFLADIELPGQGVVVCHCANPGSMKNCAPEGARVWVSRSDNPKRKLPYTWELVEVEGARICVNTMRANPVVGEALREAVVSELSGYDEVQPEVRLPSGSRLDFALARDSNIGCYLEVKSVTMGVGAGVSAFPDSVTKRGKKHLDELVMLKEGGYRAVLFFCAGRDDTQTVRPADEIDPEYGRTLRRAVRSGVEVLAYRMDITDRSLMIGTRVPIEL